MAYVIGFNMKKEVIYEKEVVLLYGFIIFRIYVSHIIKI